MPDMNDSGPQHPLRTIVLVAIVYVVVGMVTATLARSAPSIQIRTMCRLAAWVISAVFFAVHIVHERRLAGPARRAALHTAAAVALATLVLAGSAVVRQAMMSTLRPSMLLAFAVWPVLTGVVSFLVALGVVALLARIGRSLGGAATSR